MNDTTDSPSDEDEPDAANTTNQVLDIINSGHKHNMAQSQNGDPSEVRQQIIDNMANQHHPQLLGTQQLFDPYYRSQTNNNNNLDGKHLSQLGRGAREERGLWCGGMCR